VADVPADLLRALYGASEAVIPPSKCTIWRVVTGVDCAALDAAIGAWPARRAGAGTGEDEPAATALFALIVDGKTVRGAVAADGTQVHLLAAATHEHALVLAQTDVSAKTNEIPMFAPLLDTLDITGAVITADALHTQRRHADYLHRRNAHYVFCVKDNQPGLFDALDALDWKQVPVTHTSTCRGHGRVETRALQVMPAPPDLPFPHVQQVFLVEREVTDLARNALSNVAIFGITSLGSDRAGPTTLAALTRGHWGIESLHWIRDTLYREDDSRAHTRSGPRAMASLRNLAIGALRLAGRSDTAEATRWAARRMEPSQPSQHSSQRGTHLRHDHQLTVGASGMADRPAGHDRRARSDRRLLARRFLPDGRRAERHPGQCRARQRPTRPQDRCR